MRQKQLKHLLTDEWIKKKGIKIQWNIYSALKKKELLTHAMTWMNLEDIK